MTENLLLALEITGLGMGLVFLAIIVLWLMMVAMVSLPFNKPAEEVKSKPEKPLLQDDSDLMAQAAAAAVAIALADQGQSSARPLPQPPTALVSAWQLGMRSRQMYEKGGRLALARLTHKEEAENTK